MNKNTECLNMLKSKFPGGDVYSSNAKWDDEGFEYLIPGTEYSVGCNRRWLGIRKNRQTISFIHPAISKQVDFDGNELTGFEHTLAELIAPYH